jgi:aspartyl protease family protein
VHGFSLFFFARPEEHGVGLFHVSGRLTGPTGRSQSVELLVDTGATFLVVPRDLAERLELRVLRTCPIQTAGGRDETWPLSEVRLALDAVEVTTPCLIAEAGPALLGAVALESLLLGVDPIAKRLVPVKGFVG